ncbi:MAG: hypothetical protein QXW37_03955 [Candidatus Nitrosotenuis sp.]
MALAGLRPEVLGNYHGDDGLKISDIQDLQIQNGDVFFTRIPAKVVVRSALSKARHQYFTFLPEIGCKYLQGYVRQRIADGEVIKPEAPVITFQKGYKTKTNGNTCHLRINTITKEIKNTFGIIIKERPYVLRSYFDTMRKNTEQTHLQTKSYESKLVDNEDELVSCVQNGWEVIKELNNGKVLLRRTVSKDWLRASHHSN